MSIEIIQERLASYRCHSAEEEENALREITQEIALAALSHTDFYKVAAFQGGTCLRVFYRMFRFSEDLDFILKTPDPRFDFKPYLKNLSLEFEAYGYQLEVVDRSKGDRAIKKVFLKDGSLGKILQLSHLKANPSMRTPIKKDWGTGKIKIKMELDTNPPQGSRSESKHLEFPFIFSVTIQDLPSLFGGKVHALLCRKYLKGRDWYDFLWYIGQNVPINFDFLSAALNQTGPWEGRELKVDFNWVVKQLSEKIYTIDWQDAKSDTLQFVKELEHPSLDLWGKGFFLELLERYEKKRQ